MCLEVSSINSTNQKKKKKRAMCKWIKKHSVILKKKKKIVSIYIYTQWWWWLLDGTLTFISLSDKKSTINTCTSCPSTLVGFSWLLLSLKLTFSHPLESWLKSRDVRYAPKRARTWTLSLSQLFPVTTINSTPISSPQKKLNK